MLRLSRRQLLKTTAISTALATTPQSVLADLMKINHSAIDGSETWPPNYF